MTNCDTIKPSPALSLAATLDCVSALSRAFEQCWEDQGQAGQHIILNVAAMPYQIPQMVTF